MKIYNITNTSGHRKTICTNLFVGISFLLLTLLTVKFFAPQVDTDATSQQAEQTVGPYTMSMANDSAATVNVTPTESQQNYTATNNLTITNTCSAGATVTIKTSGTSNALTRSAVNSDTLQKAIPATTGTTLVDNSWGFSRNNGSTWAAVPASNGTAATVYDESAARAASSAAIPVMFGVRVDNSTPSGSYTNDVVYTMTPKAGCLTYSVTWDFDGGTAKSGATYKTSMAWGETTNLSTLTPTRSGYTFNGWTVGSTNFTGSETAANLNTNNANSITVKAKWTSVCASGATCESVTLSKNGVKNYDYTGTIKGAILTNAGYYKLEAWGAQGGGTGLQSKTGGYGGYSVGIAQFESGQILYLVVGGTGSYAQKNCVDSSGTLISVSGGYNGGGMGGTRGDWNCVTSYGAAGGGATHIAKISGVLSSLGSYKGTLINNSYYESDNILIVAGGGGGIFYETSSNTGNGGHGGGLRGNDPTGYGRDNNGYSRKSYGATQIAGGTYDRNSDGAGVDGVFGTATTTARHAAGGGGGFYGGGTANYSPGGGGSGYIASPNLISGGGITKHMTCYSCTTSTVAATRTNSNTNVSATATADYSKTGNGYARITYLGTSI